MESKPAPMMVFVSGSLTTCSAISRDLVDQPLQSRDVARDSEIRQNRLFGGLDVNGISDAMQSPRNCTGFSNCQFWQTAIEKRATKRDTNCGWRRLHVDCGHLYIRRCDCSDVTVYVCVMKNTASMSCRFRWRSCAAFTEAGSGGYLFGPGLTGGQCAVGVVCAAR